MSYKFNGEVVSDIEWEANPERAECSIDDELFNRLPEIFSALKTLGMSYASKWWAASWELFDEEGEVFEPAYRINGCTIKLYADGEVSFIMPLKHSSECLSIGPFKLSDAVQE